MKEKGYTGTFSKLWSEGYLNFTKEDWDFLTTVDIFYSARYPTDDVMYFLNTVKDVYDIYYVTSRPDYVRLTTEQFLRRYDFPFRENLVFTSDKATFARSVRCDYFIDDLPKNLETVKNLTRPILIARPYNREYWDVYNTAFSLKGALNFME
jgi:uncharacterized HAD superfamily protein